MATDSLVLLFTQHKNTWLTASPASHCLAALPATIFAFNSSAATYPKNLIFCTPMFNQIRNYSLNCTLANILGSVYFASWGKSCGYFAFSQRRFSEWVTSKVPHTKRQGLRFRLGLSLQFTQNRQESTNSLPALKPWQHYSIGLSLCSRGSQPG